MNLFSGRTPTSEKVACRAICLAHLVERASIESELWNIREDGFDDPMNSIIEFVDSVKGQVEEVNPKMLEKFLDLKTQMKEIVKSDGNSFVKELTDKSNRMKNWLDSTGFFRHFSRHEKFVMGSKPGTWNLRTLTDAVWRIEAMGILLWALNIEKNILPYDATFKIADFTKLIPIMTNVKDFVGNAKLRDQKEIAEAREIAELWNWRSRTTKVQKEKLMEPPEGYTFPQIIKLTVEKAFKDRVIPEPIENDFPALGKAYRDLDEDEFQLLSSIAEERHFALNWLCGCSKDWDNTPTET